jgi:quercetin dioxygenase-like cupin family protein
MSLTEPISDPVHEVSYAFEPRDENLFVETWMKPGGELPEHFHPVQVERWWVIEGTVRFQLGDAKREIGPADGEMLVEAGVRHALKNTGSDEVHLGCMVLPAGGLQDFLTDSAAAAREGMFMKGGIPKSLKGARWAATFLRQHRDETVMTFPPQLAQSAMIKLLAR